jgi:hypothetical protein
MFKVTKLFRECHNIFKKEMKKITIYDMELTVPVDAKYIAIDSTGVVSTYENKPEYKGRWKSGREVPTPVAIVEFEGDVKESLIKL